MNPSPLMCPSVRPGFTGRVSTDTTVCKGMVVAVGRDPLNACHEEIADGPHNVGTLQTVVPWLSPNGLSIVSCHCTGTFQPWLRGLELEKKGGILKSTSDRCCHGSFHPLLILIVSRRPPQVSGPRELSEIQARVE